MTTSTAAPSRPARLIARACIAEVLSMLSFLAFATLLPVLVAEFAITNAQAGLISGALLGGYMAAVAVLGPLTDRTDARHVYLVAASVACLGTLGFGLLAQGFRTALLFQVVIGIGLAGMYIPGLKLLTDRLQGRAQSRGAAFYGSTFGVGSALSIAITGALAGWLGWRTTFMIASIGPLVGALVMMRSFGALAPQPRNDRSALLDFRPVLRNAAVRPYLFANAAHGWELYAVRAWLVSFIVFADQLRGDGERLTISVTSAAALITLLGPVASITGNELAHRFGRRALIQFGAATSAVGSFMIGFLASLPWPALLVLIAVHTILMLIDGSVITSGMVANAQPSERGSTMALYSCLGLGAGFFSPALFGVVLDLAGGRATTLAWGCAFASLGMVGLLAVWIARALPRDG